MEQYTFTPTVYEAGLEGELADALEKRTEVVSRAAHPKMWKTTDSLRNFAAGGAARKGQVRSSLPRILLLAGALLAILGLLSAPLRGLVTLGILIMILGLLRLLRARLAQQSGTFRQAAVMLLQNMSRAATANVQVIFGGDGMSVSAQDSARSVPYADVELLVETPRLYLLTYQGQATVLQKKDLAGDPEAFTGFLAAHAVSVYRTEEK